MKENKFQNSLIKKIKQRFPGCIVMKNDPSYIQGIPDLTILHGKNWACLECKRSAYAKKQANQGHYISKMKKMSYAAFVYPENEEEVLNELEQTFSSRR